jgi:purine-binding chemotaxis protein CheW
MSNNDRMERARRIQELRDGQREGDSASENGDEADAADETAADVAAAAELDEAVAEAVERVTDSDAEVPDPEEMVGSVEPEPADTDDETAAAEDVASPAGVDRGTQPTEEKTRVLEFMLGSERYCLDIEYIEEIVRDTAITRVPNTPDFVEGVVDLRGQITTILNPKIRLEPDDTDPGDLLVVFDSEGFEEQGYLGWVVDDVRQVSPVAEDQVNDPPFDDEHVNGVIDREDDDELVVWTSPEMAIDEAT